MNAKLTDNTIGQVAKCLQLAILTGTDIVDHLRQMVFVVTDGKIEVSPEFATQFESNVQDMLQELQEKQAAQKKNLFD